VRFLWAKIRQQRISAKKCCPCMLNIDCHVKQPSKTTYFWGTLSWWWRGWKSTVRVVPITTTRILHGRFPGTCEMVGRVIKFVWRLFPLPWLVFLTLTEIFPCFFLSCKANARVKLAKTGHGPHSTTLVCICVVRLLLFVLFYVVIVCKCVLPPGDNPVTVNKYIIYHYVEK
jgi:hypothetical protein